MRPVAFVCMGLEFRAFPEHGCYYAVTKSGLVPEALGRPCLLYVPMMVDGSPAKYEDDGEIDVGEVCNMHEPGDDKRLKEINAEFGTHFKQSDFAGR